MKKKEAKKGQAPAKEEKVKKDDVPVGPLSPAAKKQLLLAKAAAINKHFGKIVVVTADKARNPYFVRRPTGIMELDVDLGGGFPPGISYISGPDGAGKSHLVYRTMAMHQRLYGERAALALASVETPIDHFFLRKLGVIVAVPDEMIAERNQWRLDRGLPGFTKDEIKELKRQVGTFMDITGGTMEETFMSILDILADKSIRSAGNQFGIIAVDSINALTPQAWLNADLDEEKRRAAHAGCMTSFWGQYYPLCTSLSGDQQYTTLLFTQQVRSNAAKATAAAHIAKFLPDYAPAQGAYAGKHGKLIDLMIWPGVKKKDKKEEGQTAKAETLQKMFSWELLKGKAGTHEGKTGEVPFEFENQEFINLQRTVLLSGIRCGVFKEQAGLITMLNPETQVESSVIKDLPAADLIQHMRENIEFEAGVRLEILKANNIQCKFVD